MRHTKQSRDLYPKKKIEPNRWPWNEPDDNSTTTAVKTAATIGFFVILGLIWIVAYLGNKYNW